MTENEQENKDEKDVAPQTTQPIPARQPTLGIRASDVQTARPIPIDGVLAAEDLEVFRAATKSDQLLAVAALTELQEVLRLSKSNRDPALLVSLFALLLSLNAISISRGSFDTFERIGSVVVAGLIVFVFIYDHLHTHQIKRRLGEIAGRLTVYERIYDSTDG